MTRRVAPGVERFVIAAALLCCAAPAAHAGKKAPAKTRRSADFAPELSPAKPTVIKKKVKRASLRPPRKRTAPSRPLVRPGLRRVRADGLARLVSSAGGGAVDIRIGAETRLQVAKRKISLRVKLPAGSGGTSSQLVLRGRLIGDGAEGSVGIAFTRAEVRRTRGGVQLREAVADVRAIRGTLRLDGEDVAVDLTGLDGALNQSFGMESSGARMTLRAAAGPRAIVRTGRTATTLNMTAFDLGEGVEALRWIVEVEEPGMAARRYELGGVLDVRTRSLHGMTVAAVGGRRGDTRQLEPLFERQVLNSLRARGDDLRIVGGIRAAD